MARKGCCAIANMQLLSHKPSRAIIASSSSPELVGWLDG